MTLRKISLTYTCFFCSSYCFPLVSLLPVSVVGFISAAPPPPPPHLRLFSFQDLPFPVPIPSTVPSKYPTNSFLEKTSVFTPQRSCTCPFLISSGGDLTGTWISPHHLPPQSGVQAQQPWALETPIVPERVSWAEAHSTSSLWDEVTILRSQLRSQAQVRLEILVVYV